MTDIREGLAQIIALAQRDDLHPRLIADQIREAYAVTELVPTSTGELMNDLASVQVEAVYMIPAGLITSEHLRRELVLPDGRRGLLSRAPAEHVVIDIQTDPYSRSEVRIKPTALVEILPATDHTEETR